MFTHRAPPVATERVATYREDPDRLTEWNQYVYGITAEATERVADFTSFSVLHDHLDDVVKSVGAYDTGFVLIDSLEELAVIQPTNALQFVKDLRANLCKGRLVPVVGGATYVFEDTGFPQTVRYFADGIVELDVREPAVEIGGDAPAEGAADPASATPQPGVATVADAATTGDAVDAGGFLERTVRVLKMQGVTVNTRRIPYEYERCRGMGLTDG